MTVNVNVQPRVSSSGGKSREEMIDEIVVGIRSRLPGEFDVEAIQMQYPVKYEDSMNTVLVQVRYAACSTLLLLLLPLDTCMSGV